MAPQWGAADAEVKVPSGESTELKRSPLKPGVGHCGLILAQREELVYAS